MNALSDVYIVHFPFVFGQKLGGWKVEDQENTRINSNENESKSTVLPTCTQPVTSQGC